MDFHRLDPAVANLHLRCPHVHVSRVGHPAAGFESLVTSIAQTILDLGSQDFQGEGDLRTEAVRHLMTIVDPEELAELAGRTRGTAALRRARKVASHA